MLDDQAFTALASTLGALGLGDLVSRSADGTPSGWLAAQLQAGKTPDQVMQDLEMTSSFQRRYPVITAQRQAAEAGQPVHVMTMGEVLSTESRFSSLARYYGLPPGMYDSYQDFQNLMVKGVTPDLFEASALKSYADLQSAPPEVRQQFGEWFGPLGDSMLASWFMDPDHVTARSDKLVAAATAGGYARTYGFQLAKDTALRLADMGYASPQQIAGGLAKVGAQGDIFRETATEAQQGSDLEAGVEGVAAAFDLPGGGQAQSAIQKRVEGRQAAFGGGGGVATSRTGLAGLGSAE